VALVAWQILGMAGALDMRLFPAPSVLAACGWQMLWNGELPAALGATLNRLGIGFALGGLSGLICGLLLGSVRAVRSLFEPLVGALLLVPLLGLLPLFRLWWGAGDASRVAVVAASCFLLVTIHVREAARAVEPAWVALASNYGAGKLALFKRVYLPAALPRLLTGLRLALESGFVMTISVELVAPSDGLGGMILLGWQRSMSERLYLGVLLSAALGLSLHTALRRLQACLVPWLPAHADLREPRRAGPA
jgi:ABC-type nitrate/sulfonate/bicarbonate transport system permease component